MGQESFRGFGGVQLAGESFGSPDDPGVLLLHGGGQARAVWEEAARALALAGRHVITLDLRGHGQSEWPTDGRYDLDAYVGDIRAVLAELGSRPVIVAANLGGWIATAALGEGGEHLATGLVLIDAAPRIDSGSARKVTASMRRKAGEQANAGPWDPRFLDGIDTATIEPRLIEDAARIQVPTLIVRGENSPLSTREAMRELVDRMPDVEFAEVEGASHLVATDKVEAFNALLVDFLERRVPRSAPEYQAGSDARTLRDALGCFATGVTIVTTLDAEGKPVGLTANSFTSVSLDPPLLLVCIGNTANTLPCFRAREHFGVNVLHIGQQLASNRFARKDEERFAATPWEAWETGIPILKGSLASFECTREALHEAGDHVLLVGRVRRVRFEPRRDPLLFFRGKYRRLHFA